MKYFLVVIFRKERVAILTVFFFFSCLFFLCESQRTSAARPPHRNKSSRSPGAVSLSNHPWRRRRWMAVSRPAVYWETFMDTNAEYVASQCFVFVGGRSLSRLSCRVLSPSRAPGTPTNTAIRRRNKSLQRGRK